MEEKKITNRKLQALQTQDKLYEIAIKVIGEKGFNNVTIEEITKKAGVSVGTFYNYYNSKNDIYNELYKRADDYFKNEVSHLFKGANTLEHIIKYFNYYVCFSISNGVDTLKHIYNTKNKLFIKKGRYMQTLLQQIVEKGQQDKNISTCMTSEEMTTFLFILVRGMVYDWCLHDSNYDLEERVTSYLRLILIPFQV
jgi:TetR/AcrR family transcriptional regulator, fatty acid metabolism regulator protein